MNTCALLVKSAKEKSKLNHLAIGSSLALSGGAIMNEVADHKLDKINNRLDRSAKRFKKFQTHPTSNMRKKFADLINDTRNHPLSRKHIAKVDKLLSNGKILGVARNLGTVGKVGGLAGLAAAGIRELNDRKGP